MNASGICRRPILPLVASALAILVLASPGTAQVLATNGDCVQPPKLPPSLLDDDYQSDNWIAVFREVQNRRLKADLTVDISAEGTYPPDAGGTMVIPAGKRVNSYIFHADPLTTGGQFFLGDVLFHETVLGVIYTDGGLDASDALVGHPAVTYPNGLASRGTEIDKVDVITWSGARITLDNEAPDKLDQMRVITLAPDLFFSLDIGSDTEFSDPAPDGDEVFDPGCVYVSDAFDPLAFALRWDDDAILPLTNFPESPIPAPYGCAGSPEDCYAGAFDLDGYDFVNVHLDKYLPGPVFRSSMNPSEQLGIHPPRNMVISYDDDPAPGWVAGPGAMPVLGTSPTGRTYGTTLGRDELLTVRLGGIVPPLALLGFERREYELELHIALAPNPLGTFDPADDDDVDALDAVPSVGPGRPPMRRNVHLFSADHEGTAGGLVPGAIYAIRGGVPQIMIDPVIHLGLTPFTDVDAFELTWLVRPGPNALALALVFSVDQDDPLTAVDESGGLDAATLFASFLDGTSFQLAPRLRDDIDAIAFEDPRNRDESQSGQ